MKERLPVHVDPWLLARKGEQFRGVASIAEMERLRGALVDASGNAVVELVFDNDERGHPVVHGQVSADLALICQNCLQDYRHPVTASVRLAIVANEKQADLVSGDREPLLVTDGQLLLMDLIEDELILALPIIPRHPEGECPRERDQGGEEGGQPAAENPFAVLRSLKKDRNLDEE
jgi:uncharacterized protein